MAALSAIASSAPVRRAGEFLQRDPRIALGVQAVGVLGCALVEKVHSPSPRTPDDVPISGADVTPEWLTAVLCSSAPGARVLSFSNPGGSSGSTERLALRVVYN